MVKAKTPPAKRPSTSDIAKMLKPSRADSSPDATSPGSAQASSMDVDPSPSQASVSAMEVDPSPTSLPPAAFLPAQLPTRAPKSSLVSQFGPDPRRHLLYFDVVVPNAKKIGQDMVGSYRQSLVLFMDELLKVDSTVSLFPYGLPSSVESVVLKLGSTLGSTLSQLGSYFDGLRLSRDSYPPLFVSVLLGFDSDLDLFVPNCQAQLNGIGARINLRPLQEPKVSAAGWIFGTHGDTDPSHVEKLIHEALDAKYPNHNLRLGFRLKQLWSGAKKSDPATTKKSPTPTKRPPGLRVVHIDCARDQEVAAKVMIGAVLRLPSFGSYTNLPLRLLDVLRFNSTEEECEAFACAYKRQAHISGSLSRVTSQDFTQLDIPISGELYNGASLRQLILQMKNRHGQKIFMSVNRNWNGSGYVLSFPTLYRTDAQHRASYMAKYLAMEYSERIYSRFSTAACAIAESMEWDDALKIPISATESLRREIANITFPWEIPETSLAAPASRPLVNSDNLTVSSLDNPAPAQPLLSTAVLTSASTPAANASSSVRTSGSTRLLVQQLQAQVLTLSGAPQPISANESNRRDIKTNSSSWEVPNQASVTSSVSRPTVNFDNLTVSSLDNPPAAQPLLSTALPTASAPVVADDSPVRTTSSTRLQLQKLQAQVQALTGAPPPTDDSPVTTSMSTKELLRSLVAQVTSLSAAGIQQPMAAGTPQTPAVVSSPPGSVPTDPGSGE